MEGRIEVLHKVEPRYSDFGNEFAGKYAYGWRPDRPDWRDAKYAWHPPDHLALATLPTKTNNLAAWAPIGIYDQGALGSCTANAIGGAFEYMQMKQKDAYWVPSRLHIYYEERRKENTIPWDAGATIRDSAWVVANIGVCPETDWPYAIGNFAVAPPARCYTDAAGNKAIQYNAVAQDLYTMKACLVAGNPMVIGFTVYSSFESSTSVRTGIIPLPRPGESALGGHAVIIIDYDDSLYGGAGGFICRNSWGTGFGMGGYFTVPYAYFTNPDLASDIWTLTLVTGTPVNPPTPNPSVKMVFGKQPVGGQVGDTLPAFSVQLLDGTGALSQDNTTVITAVCGTWSASVRAVNGIAVFASLRLVIAGAYAVWVSATGLPTVSSIGFNVTPIPAPPAPPAPPTGSPYDRLTAAINPNDLHAPLGVFQGPIAKSVEIKHRDGTFVFPRPIVYNI